MGDVPERDRGTGNLLGVPDRTVIKIIAQDHKAPKGLQLMQPLLLPYIGDGLFHIVVSFPTNAHTGKRGDLLFSWYHTQFSALPLVQNNIAGKKFR